MEHYLPLRSDLYWIVWHKSARKCHQYLLPGVLEVKKNDLGELPRAIGDFDLYKAPRLKHRWELQVQGCFLSPGQEQAETS